MGAPQAQGGPLGRVVRRAQPRAARVLDRRARPAARGGCWAVCPGCLCTPHLGQPVPGTCVVMRECQIRMPDGSPGWGLCSALGGGAQGPRGEAAADRVALFPRPCRSGARLTKSRLSGDVPPEPACPRPGSLASRAHTPPPVGTDGAWPPGPGCPVPQVPGPPGYVLIGTLPSAWGALAHAWGHQLVQAFVPVGGMPMVPLHWPLEHRPEPAAVSGCPSEDCLSDPTPRPASGFPAPAPWPEPSCQGCGSLLPAVGVQAPDPGPPPQVLRPLLISLPPPSCLPDGNKSTEGCPDSCGSSGAVMATAFGARALETQVGAQCLRAVAAPLTRRPRTLQPESPCVRVSVGLGVLNLKHEVAQPERPGWWAVGAPVVTLRQELAQVAGCRLGPWGRAPPAVVINEPGHNPATSGG